MRYALILVAVMTVNCSGGNNSPTAPSPTPTPPPAPIAHSLSGRVTVSGTTIGASGITIHVLDGTNAGRETVTGSDGRFQLADLQNGNANIAARRSGWEEKREGLHISGASTLNFSTQTIEPFQVIATGSRVFDMPPWVTRLIIAALYNGFCENFVVRVGGRLVVNEIVGTCGSAVGREFSGTFAVSGTVVEVNATGITWGVRELRSTTASSLDLLTHLRHR